VVPTDQVSRMFQWWNQAFKSAGGLHVRRDGVQEAFAALARLLGNSGDRVTIYLPGYNCRVLVTIIPCIAIGPSDRLSKYNCLLYQ
jgi:hypothetical protein